MINKYYLHRMALIPAFLLLYFFATAQESTKVLVLDEVIKQATENNKTVTLAALDEKISVSNYKETQATYLPQVNFSYTAATTNNPLYAFGYKLQQESITPNDFNPQVLNNPSATSDFMTKLELQQPLLNMDLLYMRKSALKQTELYHYKTERTKEYITFQAKKAYLELQLAYESKNVLEDALKTSRAMYKFTSDRVQQGLLQKSDLLNADVQIKSLENNLAEANSNIKNISDFLSQLMNTGKGVIYTTEPLNAATATAKTDSLPADRADFKAMETAMQSYDLMIKSSKMSYLPRLNAFANYQFNDNTALGFGSNAYLAGIQLSWSIFKGNQTRNKIATQNLERDKLAEQLASQKDEGNLELSKAYRQLEDAQYKIAQQKTAVDQADEALRILQNRYQQGLVNTTDVLMAQTQLSQQKLGYAGAVFANNVTVAYLQFLTSTTNQ
ncbi:MAG TPA: TolC family protein [Chitinophagaceae bacterium]|nr:TolC family protein [Chitinophagaceae bacterium]